MPDDKKPIKKPTGCSSCDMAGLSVCSCKKGGGGGSASGSAADDSKTSSENGLPTIQAGLTNKPNLTFYSPNQQFIQDGQSNGPVADRPLSPKSLFSLPRFVPPGSK